MTDLLVCALDRDTAKHLALALRRHIAALEKEAYRVPPGIAQLAEMSLEVVNKRQDESASASRRIPSDDALHEREFLTRGDIQRLTGWSLRTIDRHIRSGQLRSSKRGRARRVSRADLEEFLSATA